MNNLLRTLDGIGMALGGRLGLDLITDLQSAARFRRLVDMETDFFA